MIRCLIFILFATLSLSASAPVHAVEVSVRDGDSINIDGERIRLWGIDALELHQTCSNRGRDVACGEFAYRALQHLVGNRVPNCILVDRDRYGRSVDRCFVGGRELGAEMVRSGWALEFIYDPHWRRDTPRKSGRFASLEREARDARRGMWAFTFIDPYQWRREHPRR